MAGAVWTLPVRRHLHGPPGRPECAGAIAGEVTASFWVEGERCAARTHELCADTARDST